MNIPPSDVNMISGSTYRIPLTLENAKKISAFTNVKEIKKDVQREGAYEPYIFPHNPAYPWNVDFLICYIAAYI